VRNVLPEYPVEAVKSGVEGEIQVEILVKDDGTVEKSCSSAIGPLGTAAESAALQWMFLKNFGLGESRYGSYLTQSLVFVFELKDGKPTVRARMYKV
jgi:hypothetical protein